MSILILSFFCGVLFLQLFAVLPNLFLIIGIVLGLILIWCFSDERWRKIFQFLIAFALGFLWVFLKAYLLTSWFLPQEVEGKKVIVIGHVASLPDLNEYYESFTFDALSVDGKEQKTKLRLNWYAPISDNIFDSSSDEEKKVESNYPVIAVGDKWQLEVKLKRPHGTFNPGGFDFEKYLLQRGIRAAGYVVSSSSSYLIEANKYHYFVNRIRQNLRAKIFRSLNNKPLCGIINTLVIGDQSGISKEQWQIFRDTGTSYLMAISGLHISFVALLVFISVNFLWRLLPSLMLRLPANHAAAIFSFFAASIYSFLSGFSIPTQRALIMLAVFTITLLLRRNIKSWDVLFLALFIVLLIDPLAVLSEGFWLSFVAVGFILFVTKGRLKLKNSWWRNYCRIQWGITLGLIPFTLLLFQQASLISFAASAIALPVVCFVIIPLGLIGSLILLINFHYGGYFLWLAEKLMELVWLWLKWLSSFSWLNWFHPLFNWWIFIVSFIGIVLLLAPRGFPSKWLGIVWLLPLFFYKPAGPKYGEIWFTLLDVGQGLSVVIRTQNHITVYDSGPKFLDSDVGETIVVPFLRTLGANKINVMIISHGDDDHIGGAYSILNFFKVEKIITSVPDKFLQHGAKYCSEEQNWQWDGVSFSFINPAGSLFSSNDASCVLKIDNGVNSILLPGDIEHPIEKWLVDNRLSDLTATILVAPHHGSRTSSSAKFVKAVAAKYVLFPIGYLNRFNFPSKIVVKRYLQDKAKLFDTARFGAIIFKLDNKSPASDPLLYRITNRHYWNDK